MADNKIRVLIVENHPIFRDGLRADLDPEKDIQIVGCAMNGRDAIQLFCKTRPDVTLLDIMLGSNSDMDGTQVLQAIKREFPEAKVIMLSVRAEEEIISRSMKAGAAAYLFKDTLAEHLTLTIRQVNSGQVLRSPEVEGKLAAQNSRKSLAPRELEVLRLMGQGMRDKEIAGVLELSPFTINEYVTNIYRKLSVHDRSNAVVVAIRLGLLAPPQEWK